MRTHSHSCGLHLRIRLPMPLHLRMCDHSCAYIAATCTCTPRCILHRLSPLLPAPLYPQLFLSLKSMVHPILMKRFLFLLLLCFAGLPAFAQTAEPLDTVYLMSGKTVAGVVKDSTDDQLKILVKKKRSEEFKADFIDLDLVFSIKYRNGQEEVIYRQDTLFGNYFTPQEVRYFMYGERDARNNYRCPLWLAGAFAAGFAGGWTQSFVAPIPAFAYSGLTTAFRVKIKPGSVSNPDNIKYDTYVLGYEKEARKHRMFRSLLWSGVGMVAGFAASAVYTANK